MSAEKLFKQVERVLLRKLSPDERKFLALANRILGKERLPTKKAKNKAEAA